MRFASRLGVAIAPLLLWAAVAAAPSSAVVDTLGQANVSLEGRGGELAGSSVAGAGDMNGDGLPDLIVGAPRASPRGRASAGVAYVVFGRRSRQTVDLGALDGGGFRIIGAEFDDEAGTRVARAGDVNRDGLGDVVVTAPAGETIERAVRRRVTLVVEGAAYVVFGRRSAEGVDLGRLGRRGFAVKGIEDGDAAGAGDVNGDGRDDLVVGALDDEDGDAYVVFGGSQTRDVDVKRLGERGFAIAGAPGDLGAGAAVAGAGDVNGDRLADVLVGAPASAGAPVPEDAYEPIGPGAAYVVFGKRSTGGVELGRLDASGFRIDPPAAFGSIGLAVAGAGDVNGDGLADLAVGAPFFPADFNSNTLGGGAAFVVFGARSAERVRLGELGSRGFRIVGARPGDTAGISVAGAGDLNRDGLADVLVGAPGDEDGPPEDEPPGRAYVVYGQRSSSWVELAAIEGAPDAGGGIALAGLPGDQLGLSSAAPGDLDADGRAEIAIGAPHSCSGAVRESREASGGAAVVEGGAVYLYTVGAPPAPSRAAPTDGADALFGTLGSDRIRGRGGADSIVGLEGLDCLFGEADGDRLVGGSGGDALYGGGGSDVLLGGSGPDVIAAGPGDDRLFGSSGADDLTGGSGMDHLFGGLGGDQLKGEGGTDKLTGGRGNDGLVGRSGEDRLAGGPGRDFLAGGSGRDVLSGGSGPDSLQGNRDRDRLLAGRGDDKVETRDGSRDFVDCGGGRDRVLADRGDRLIRCEIEVFRARRL